MLILVHGHRKVQSLRFTENEKKIIIDIETKTRRESEIEFLKGVEKMSLLQARCYQSSAEVDMAGLAQPH